MIISFVVLSAMFFFLVLGSRSYLSFTNQNKRYSFIYKYVLLTTFGFSSLLFVIVSLNILTKKEIYLVLWKLLISIYIPIAFYLFPALISFKSFENFFKSLAFYFGYLLLSGLIYHSFHLQVTFASFYFNWVCQLEYIVYIGETIIAILYAYSSVQYFFNYLLFPYVITFQGFKELKEEVNRLNSILFRGRLPYLKTQKLSQEKVSVEDIENQATIPKESDYKFLLKLGSKMAFTGLSLYSLVQVILTVTRLISFDYQIYNNFSFKRKNYFSGYVRKRYISFFIIGSVIFITIRSFLYMITTISLSITSRSPKLNLSAESLFISLLICLYFSSNLIMILPNNFKNLYLSDINFSALIHCYDYIFIIFTIIFFSKEMYSYYTKIRSKDK